MRFGGPRAARQLVTPAMGEGKRGVTAADADQDAGQSW